MSGRPGSLEIQDDGVPVQRDTHTIDFQGTGFTLATDVPDAGVVNVSLSAAVNAAGYAPGWQKEAADAMLGTTTAERAMPGGINSTGAVRTISLANSSFIPATTVAGGGMVVDTGTIRLRVRDAAGMSIGIIGEIVRDQTVGWTAFVPVDFVTPVGGITTIAAGEYITVEILKAMAGITVPLGSISLAFT